MRVICRVTLSCAMLLTAISCRPAEPREDRGARFDTWSSTQGVTFRPPVPTQPSMKVATTQRPRRTLDQILQDVSPTPEERAAAGRALEQAQREWVAWLNGNRPAREQVLAENAAAAAARDPERLELEARAAIVEALHVAARPGIPAPDRGTVRA